MRTGFAEKPRYGHHDEEHDDYGDPDDHEDISRNFLNKVHTPPSANNRSM
jgi:hypothetical protein